MIKFCGNCGTTVTEKDIDEEKAYTSGKYVYCKGCAAKLGFTGDGPAPNEEEVFNAQDNMATAVLGPDQINLLVEDSGGDGTTAVMSSDLIKRKTKADTAGAAPTKQEVSCGSCGVKLRIKMGDKPKKVRCPKCQEIFTAEPAVSVKDKTEQLASAAPELDGVTESLAPVETPADSGTDELIDFNPAPEPELELEPEPAPKPKSKPVKKAKKPVEDPAAALAALEAAIPDDPPPKKAESSSLSALEELPEEDQPDVKPRGKRASASSRRRKGAPEKAASGRQKKGKEEPVDKTGRTSRRSRSAKSEKPEKASLSGRRSSASGRSSRRSGRGKKVSSSSSDGKGLLVLLVLMLLSPAVIFGILETRERSARLGEIGLKAAEGLSRIGLNPDLERDAAVEEPAVKEGGEDDPEKAAVGEKPEGDTEEKTPDDKPEEEVDIDLELDLD